MIRAVLSTRCLGCKKRIRAPSEQTFFERKYRHMRNCAALRLHGQTVPFEGLPVKVAAGLASVLPRRTLRQRLGVLLRAILRAVGWRR